MASHPPVPISELPSYIERKKANDGLRFSQEYEVRSCDVPVRDDDVPSLSPKQRYSLILFTAMKSNEGEFLPFSFFFLMSLDLFHV